MADDRVPAEIPADVPAAGDRDPEVRLELTNAGVRQVWALYSQERDGAGGAPPISDDDPLSIFLRDLPAMAWRGRWYLAACLLLAISLGTLYVLEAAPVYNVGAQVLIERRGVSLQGDDRRRDWTLATQAEIMQSPTILRAALEAMAPNPDGDAATEDAAGVEGADAAGSARLPLVQATPIVGTNVVAVSYRTDDPVRGAGLIETVIDQYGEYVRGLEKSGPLEAVELMRRKEAELRGQLAELENDYQLLRGQSQSFGEGRDALSVQKAVLERHAQMLVEAKSRRIALENQYQALRWAESRGGGSAGIPSSARAVQEELWRAELRAAELTRNYSDRHPEVQAVKNQIATLRRQLAESSKADSTAVEQELRAARGTEARLSELYERELAKSIELDAHRLKEEELAAEIARVGVIHQSALAKLKDMELHFEALTGGEAGVMIRVLDGPSPSARQVWPQPVLVLLPCAFLGLMGGLALTAISERSKGLPARSVLPQASMPRTGSPYAANVHTTS